MARALCWLVSSEQGTDVARKLPGLGVCGAERRHGQIIKNNM